ncbi:redox-sensing transcriptional repressor Rex [Bacteroidota bacterium]
MYPNKSINRLLQYRTCLNKFKTLGFNKVFSYNLGEEIGVTPEQVRKDFSLFNIKGHKKGGYDINELLFTINKLFKSNQSQQIIVVGMGNIGQALTQYMNYDESYIQIIAAFDINPVKLKMKFSIPVHPLSELEEYVKKEKIKIAVLAVPEIAAQEMCNKLIETGINGILNFTPIVLKVPDNVIVSNVNLQNEIEELIYLVNFNKR